MGEMADQNIYDGMMEDIEDDGPERPEPHRAASEGDRGMSDHVPGCKRLEFWDGGWDVPCTCPPPDPLREMAEEYCEAHAPEMGGDHTDSLTALLHRAVAHELQGIEYVHDVADCYRYHAAKAKGEEG